MSSENGAEYGPLVVIDSHLANGFFYVAAVSSTHYVTSRMTPEKKEAVSALLFTGRNAIEALELIAPETTTIVPMPAIKEIHWQEKEAWLKIDYRIPAEAESKTAEFEFRTAEIRDQFVEEIHKITGESEREETPVSIWVRGTAPFIISGFAILIFGGTSLAAFVDPGPYDEEKVRGSRAAALLALTEAVGASGLAMIAVSIVAAMMLLWLILCLSRPKRIVLRPINNQTIRSA